MSPRQLALGVTAASLAASGFVALIGGPEIEIRIQRLARRVGMSATVSPEPSPLPPLPSPVPVEAALGSLPVRQFVPGGASSGEGFGRIRQLSFGGCCPGAWWSADGQALHYLDRPAETGQSGIYAQPIWPPGALPQILDTRADMRAAGTRFLVRPEADFSVVKDVESGLEWPLPTGGNPVRLSPDGHRAVWWEAAGGREQVDALARIYASGIDGLEPIEIGALWGLDVLAFLPDGRDILALGRPNREVPLYVLNRIDSLSGASRELARGMWLSQVSLSTGSSWLAYTISLDTQDPEANGLWIAPTTPGLAETRRLEVFGAYRWRDDSRLVYVPMLPGAGSHALVEYDATSGSSALLFDPTELPISIAANDWSISPDGKVLAFRSADDGNIWLVNLPE